MSSIPKHVVFLSLPNELLILVKENIPEWDLRTHVCYHHSCVRIAKLYGDNKEQEIFWRRACWLAGLGCIRDEQSRLVSWTDVAFHCIARDGFCNHPQCGGALLERNAHLMETEDAHLHKLMMAFNYTELDEVEEQPLLEWLEYSKEHQDFEPEADGYLRPESEDIAEAIVPDLLLANHPIACRSFVTFPPLPLLNISVLALERSPTFQRESGITVWDFNMSLHSLMQEDLQTENLACLYDFYLRYGPGQTSQHWSTMGVLQNFYVLRDVFKALYVHNLSSPSSTSVQNQYGLL
ncbi:hypothetical protein B0H21DRAFT_714656 [Amylocystis lapponica]|nr:hypothetical protein B0H21DRAFT_714656 [Amylocystis lapponica]